MGPAAVSSCPTDGTTACIQLRADAVGYAVNQLFVTANASMNVTNQFRIGLYPFIQDLYAYFALTSSINGSSTNPSTINYAAANLASQLDTNTNAKPRLRRYAYRHGVDNIEWPDQDRR